MNCHEHVKYLLFIVHGSKEIADFHFGNSNIGTASVALTGTAVSTGPSAERCCVAVITTGRHVHSQVLLAF